MRAIAYFLTKRKQQHRLDSPTSGFTMVEILVVVIMVGVLAAIGGAGYVSWLDRLRVSAARDVVLNAVQDAKIKAKQRNATWQVSIRDTTVNGKTVVQWAVHSPDPNLNNVLWQTIEQSGVKLDTAKTLNNGTPANPWQVQFNNKGNTDNDGDKITLSNSLGGQRRCVIVKTILGAISSDRDGENCDL